MSLQGASRSVVVGRGTGRRKLLILAVALLVSTVPAVILDQEVGRAQVAGEGLWERTGSLSVPRYDHTTTLLADGKVLAAAGREVPREGPITLLRSAEIYDPHSEKWRLTGSLSIARWRHTATLLPDGRVLVAGGFGDAYRPGSNAQPVLNSAEIFDPATRTWSRTDDLNVRRALHVAMLLPNGKVLVAGGRTCNEPPPTACNFTFRTNTAEIFDPATGTWTLTGPLVFDRHTTSAALLRDGKVLVPAGFVSGASPSDTAEVFDHTTRTWSLTGNLNQRRARQGAMLLPDGTVLVAAGFQGGNTAEVYNPAADTWSLTGSLALPTRFNFNYAVLPNGKALIAGGATFPPAGRTRTAELYDPVSRQWTSAAEMHGEHGSSGSLSNSDQAVVLSSSPWRLEFRPNRCAPNCGKVLVAGNNPEGWAELYTPTCPSSMPRPPQQLRCVGAATQDSRSSAVTRREDSGRASSPPQRAQ